MVCIRGERRRERRQEGQVKRTKSPEQKRTVKKGSKHQEVGALVTVADKCTLIHTHTSSGSLEDRKEREKKPDKMFLPHVTKLS